MKRVVLFLISVATSTSAFAQLYFAPRVNYTLPSTNTFVNISFGDFNKDNNLDMVVSNFSSARLSVFPGNGDGTFGAEVTLTTSSGPGGSSVYDFNGDGNLDIAVANYSSNNIGIFYGNGNGTFSGQTTFATGSGPQYPALGDYNEDGKIDIAVSNFTANTVTYYFGDGTGTFTLAGTLPTGPNPSVGDVDLNADGHLDLIILNTAGGNVGVRIGTGTGTFGAVTNYTTGTTPRGLAVADFNGDNKLDIAVGNVASNSVSLLTGVGDGTFNAAINFTTTGPSTLISGDFNADGRQDLAVSNTGNNTVSIYTGNGNGTFGLYQYTSVGSSPNYMRLVILDLNNDGQLDIVTSNDNTNLVGVLVGNVPLPNPGTALSLNGTNQRADLGTWFNASSFTISMWVKPGAAQSAGAAIVDNNYSAVKSWTFQQNGANTNQYFFDHNGGTSNLVTLTAGVWQHVALVSANGIFSIFVNGQFVTSRDGGPNVYDGSQSLRLGNTAGTQYWNGELDEVRFYNAALTQVQIKASLCSEISSATPNLVAYYHLNEGSGGFIYDATVGNHTGTLVNTPLFTLSGVTVPVPTITNVSPASGYPGSTVAITGTNFNPTASSNDVKFNGSAAIVISASTTTLIAIIPAAATSGDITVSENCQTATSATPFTVVQNTIVSFEHFIDTEPGFNSGTLTSIAPTALVNNQDIAVDVSALTQGNHMIYVRAKDNNGRINQVYASSFTVLPPVCPSPPVTSGASACAVGSVQLSASGATAGQYRWYTVSSGGTALAGEVNPTFTTPPLSTTTIYYVAIDDGQCESSRTPVTATINSSPPQPSISSPIPPVGTTVTICTTTTVTLSAPPGYQSYLWSSGSGNETIDVGTAGSFTVAVTNAFGCTSIPSQTLTVAVTDCSTNLPPVISSPSASAEIEGSIGIDLLPLLSDPDNNIVVSSLEIAIPPASGAIATIDGNFVLHIDYEGISFSGSDHLSIRVCDLAGACVVQEIEIKVTGDVEVFNALSPNGDGKNDVWIIQYIDLLPDTKNNHVTIYSRWGDIIFDQENYDNGSHVFHGTDKNGKPLPSGTYFYKIQFTSAHAPLSGFIEIR